MKLNNKLIVLSIVFSTIVCTNAFASHKSLLMFYNQTDKPVKLALYYSLEMCYHNGGPDHFTVPANWHYGISIEDSNALFEGCTDVDKLLSWYVNDTGLIAIDHGKWSGWQSYGIVLAPAPRVRHIEFLCTNGTRSGDGRCSKSSKEDGYMAAIRFCNGNTVKCKDDLDTPFDFSGHWEGEFSINNHDHTSHYCHFKVTADIDTENNTVHWTSSLTDYNLFHCPISQDVTRPINKTSQKIMDTSIIFAQGKGDRIVRLTPETIEDKVISGQGVFGDIPSQTSNTFSTASSTRFNYWERLERK